MLQKIRPLSLFSVLIFQFSCKTSQSKDSDTQSLPERPETAVGYNMPKEGYAEVISKRGETAKIIFEQVKLPARLGPIDIVKTYDGELQVSCSRPGLPPEGPQGLPLANGYKCRAIINSKKFPNSLLFNLKDTAALDFWESFEVATLYNKNTLVDTKEFSAQLAHFSSQQLIGMGYFVNIWIGDRPVRAVGMPAPIDQGKPAGAVGMPVPIDQGKPAGAVGMPVPMDQEMP
jgi:hypothetical protein